MEKVECGIMQCYVEVEIQIRKFDWLMDHSTSCEKAAEKLGKTHVFVCNWTCLMRNANFKSKIPGTSIGVEGSKICTSDF